MPKRAAGKAKAKTTTRKPPDLTPRETRLAMLYAEGTRPLSECLRMVGLNPSSGDLYRRVKEGDIRQAVLYYMRQYGLSVQTPILKIRQMYDAKKEIPNPVAHSEAAQLAAMSSGNSVPATMELRDNESQRWAVEQTLRLLDAYPKKDEGPESTGVPAVQVVFSHVDARQVHTGIEIVTVDPGNGNGHNGNGHHGVVPH